MENGISLLYQCFTVMIYCLALTMLICLSHMVYAMEHQVDQNMYQQHVLSCEIARF